jgi:hypothetical protein
MDYTKLPHDGEVFVRITNKDFIAKLERACDTIKIQNQSLFDLAVCEAKKLGFEGVYSTYGRGIWISSFMAYVTVPKSLSKSWNEKMHNWRDKKYQKSLEKLNALNDKSKGSRKSYIMEKKYYTESEEGRTLAVSEITPKSDSIFRKNDFKPIKSVSEIFRDEILEFKKIDCVIEKNPTYARGSLGSHVMRQMYVVKEFGEWFGVIPVSKNENQPEEFKLPKGMKRLTMSGYWKLKEKLALNGA